MAAQPEGQLPFQQHRLLLVFKAENAVSLRVARVTDLFQKLHAGVGDHQTGKCHPCVEPIDHNISQFHFTLRVCIQYQGRTGFPVQNALPYGLRIDAPAIRDRAIGTVELLLHVGRDICRVDAAFPCRFFKGRIFRIPQHGDHQNAPYFGPCRKLSKIPFLYHLFLSVLPQLRGFSRSARRVTLWMVPSGS